MAKKQVKGSCLKLTGLCMSVCILVMSSLYTVCGAEPVIPVSVPVSANVQAVSIQAPSAVLMEASTGKVLFEKEGDEKRSPASVTKVMTLLLIFDALKAGKIKMTDQVTTSAYAKSMGGSQVFLEEGEVQTVETLIKCIVIASGNDASVAMAEYISGTEEAFVDAMNKRAEGLGMVNTHFTDCCGLTEDPDHLTTARDIAIMSRELINCYPEIHNYSTIWMENITHVTRQGTKEFGLANTNKLLKMAADFQVTGLKTGSTSRAKYCLSATAQKDGVRLIAVIMAAPDYKARFSDARNLLNFGYAVCRLYEDKEKIERFCTITGRRHIYLAEYRRGRSGKDREKTGIGRIPGSSGGTGRACRCDRLLFKRGKTGGASCYSGRGSRTCRISGPFAENYEKVGRYQGKNGIKIPLK